jgi:hypothetical protein
MSNFSCFPGAPLTPARRLGHADDLVSGRELSRALLAALRAARSLASTTPDALYGAAADLDALIWRITRPDVLQLLDDPTAADQD